MMNLQCALAGTCSKPFDTRLVRSTKYADSVTQAASHGGVYHLGSHIDISIPHMWLTVSQPRKKSSRAFDGSQDDIPHDPKVGGQKNNEQEGEVSLLTERGVI